MKKEKLLFGIIIFGLVFFTSCENVAEFLSALDRELNGLEPVASYFVAGNGDDDANDGLSQTAPFRTLSKAVSAAESSAIKKITVVHVLDIDECPGTENTFKISDSGTDEILITGIQNAKIRADAGKRVIMIMGDSNIRFENITITGGDLSAYSGNSESGAGVCVVDGAKVTLGNGCIITANIHKQLSPAGNGGGIEIYDSTPNDSFPTIVCMEAGAVITGNTVYGKGGGVFVNGGIFVKTGGIIYGNEGAVGTANLAPYGAAVWASSLLFRDKTVGENVSLDSRNGINWSD